MKVDALFYELFQQFPGFFFELLGQPDVNDDDYELIAPEVKQPTFRFDGILKPKSSSAGDTLYFIEVQFQKRQKFYARLFAEIYLYFNQYDLPYEDWYAVVIYNTRNTEVSPSARYQELIDRRVIRVYLNEVRELATQFLGVAIVRLISITSKRKMQEEARRVLDWAAQRPVDTLTQEQAIELVQKIVLYRFPDLSQEDLEAMLNLVDLKKTRIYQEIQDEVSEAAERRGELKAKHETIARMIQRDFNLEEIASVTDLDLKTTKEAAIAAMLKSGASIKQMAQRLRMDTTRVIPAAVRVLLAEDLNEEQIAQKLEISVSSVRRVARSKGQQSEID